MSRFRHAVACAAVLAGTSAAVSPVAAATRTIPISVPLSARPAQQPAWTGADEIFNDHRWRGYNRHRGGIDGGDLLGVLLIGGGIAAVAAAIDADKKERRGDRTQGRDYPVAERPYDYSRERANPDRDYGGAPAGADRPYDYRESRDETYRRAGQLDGRETDRAVEACSAEAARAGAVDQIFDAQKIDGEWQVKGDLRDGRSFTCSVDGNGKAYVGLGNREASDPVGQIGVDEDDRYGSGRSPDFDDPRDR